MPYRYKKLSDTKKGVFSKPVVLITLAVIVVAVGIATLELTDTTHMFHKRKATSSTIPAEVNTDSSTDKKDTPKANEPSTPANKPTDSPPTSEKSTASPSSGSDLLAPSGSFVSNHRPSMSGPPSSAEESVCTTTPGASCTIIFQKNGVTKTLESKQADSNGTVIWKWDVVSAGFDVGTWKITATATLGDQTKSQVDLQPLEVQP